MKKPRYFTFAAAIVFVIGTTVAFLLTRQLAIQAEMMPNHPTNVFYWLAPECSALLTGNLVLLWGGIVSGILGAIVPIVTWKKDLAKLIFLAILNAGISTLTTYGLAKSLVNDQDVSFDLQLFLYSIKMYVGLVVFLAFWSLICYGIRLTFSNRWFALVVGVVVQVGEVFLVYRYQPEMEMYLPTALSRELVVNQYPFWEVGSWANLPDAFAFGSTPMTVDDHYRIVEVSPMWVTVFLLWYLTFVFIIPIINSLSSRRKETTSC